MVGGCRGFDAECEKIRQNERTVMQRKKNRKDVPNEHRNDLIKTDSV